MQLRRRRGLPPRGRGARWGFPAPRGTFGTVPVTSRRGRSRGASPALPRAPARWGGLSRCARARGEHCGAERRHFERGRRARGACVCVCARACVSACVRARGGVGRRPPGHPGGGGTRDTPGKGAEPSQSSRAATLHPSIPPSFPRRAARTARGDGGGRAPGGAAESRGSVCPHSPERAVRVPAQPGSGVCLSPQPGKREHPPGRPAASLEIQGHFLAQLSASRPGAFCRCVQVSQ